MDQSVKRLSTVFGLPEGELAAPRRVGASLVVDAAGVLGAPAVKGGEGGGGGFNRGKGGKRGRSAPVATM